MKPNGQRSILISAVAGGLVAGALLASNRSRPSAELAVPVASESVVHLPVLRENPPPAAPVIYEARIETPKPRRWLAWICVALVLGLGLAFVISQRPQVAIAPPPFVVAGTPAALSYSASGNGTLTLDVDAGSYRRTFRLSERAGALAIPASATRAGHDVVATLRMSGLFGSDAQAFRVPVRAAVRAPQAAAGTPLIRDLVLSKTAARGGEHIFARYDTNATGGSLRVTDASGVVWVSRPVRGNGIASIAVPRMHADTPFIVAVQAERDGRSITSSAGFVALSATPAKPPVTASADTPPATFALPANVRSGATLAIRVPAAYAQATLALSRADGSAMLAPALQTQHRVLLHVPAVATAQPAFATLSYQRGKVKETLIRRVTIEP